MAYHDMHDRSPFLDSALQATLEKRTVELIGIGVCGREISTISAPWSRS